VLLRQLHSSGDLLGSPGDYRPSALEILVMLRLRDTLSRPSMHAMLRVMAHNSSGSSFAARRFRRLHSRPRPSGGGFVSSVA
jgi:hypothetical protein